MTPDIKALRQKYEPHTLRLPGSRYQIGFFDVPSVVMASVLNTVPGATVPRTAVFAGFLVDECGIEASKAYLAAAGVCWLASDDQLDAAWAVLEQLFGGTK